MIIKLGCLERKTQTIKPEAQFCNLLCFARKKTIVCALARSFLFIYCFRKSYCSGTDLLNVHIFNSNHVKVKQSGWWMMQVDCSGLQWSAGVCMRSTFCCTLHLCSCTIQHPTEDKAASFMCKPSLDSLIKKTQWLLDWLSYCSWVMMKPSISVQTTLYPFVWRSSLYVCSM